MLVTSPLMAICEENYLVCPSDKTEQGLFLVLCLFLYMLYFLVLPVTICEGEKNFLLRLQGVLLKQSYEIFTQIIARRISQGKL